MGVPQGCILVNNKPSSPPVLLSPDGNGAWAPAAAVKLQPQAPQPRATTSMGAYPGAAAIPYDAQHKPSTAGQPSHQVHQMGLQRYPNGTNAPVAEPLAPPLNDGAAGNGQRRRTNESLPPAVSSFHPALGAPAEFSLPRGLPRSAPSGVVQPITPLAAARRSVERADAKTPSAYTRNMTHALVPTPTGQHRLPQPSRLTSPYSQSQLRGMRQAGPGGGGGGGSGGRPLSMGASMPNGVLLKDGAEAWAHTQLRNSVATAEQARLAMGHVQIGDRRETLGVVLRMDADARGEGQAGAGALETELRVTSLHNMQLEASSAPLVWKVRRAVTATPSAGSVGVVRRLHARA